MIKWHNYGSKIILCWFISMLTSWVGASTIYEGTPTDGSVVFSDKPGTQSHPVNYTSVKIISPEDQTTFQNQSSIVVAVETNPPLRDGDKLQLIIDGKPYKDPQSNTALTIDHYLERGTHQIQVCVITATGATSVGNSITIYKKQAGPLLNSGHQQQQ